MFGRKTIQKSTRRADDKYWKIRFPFLPSNLGWPPLNYRGWCWLCKNSKGSPCMRTANVPLSVSTPFSFNRRTYNAQRTRGVWQYFASAQTSRLTTFVPPKSITHLVPSLFAVVCSWTINKWDLSRFAYPQQRSAPWLTGYAVTGTTSRDSVQI